MSTRLYRPTTIARASAFAAFGDNRLGVQNIGLSSGTVSVRGDEIPAGHDVYVAGRPVPVDADGSFLTEEILPKGAHTVEVAVVERDGSGELYLRDLEFKEKDWFYVGMADLTLAQNSTSGPADLMSGAQATRDFDSDIDGRLAFFVNGKFGQSWRLTASADTREGPIGEMFSNFMDKSPEALFRRDRPGLLLPDLRRRCDRRGDGADARQVLRAPQRGATITRNGAISASAT